MRKISLIVSVAFAALLVSGCAVVRTTARVTGTVVSTTVGVAGAAVKGTARAVSSIGEDEEHSEECVP